MVRRALECLPHSFIWPLKALAFALNENDSAALFFFLGEESIVGVVSNRVFGQTYKK